MFCDWVEAHRWLTFLGREQRLGGCLGLKDLLDYLAVPFGVGLELEHSHDGRPGIDDGYRLTDDLAARDTCSGSDPRNGRCLGLRHFPAGVIPLCTQSRYEDGRAVQEIVVFEEVQDGLHRSIDRPEGLLVFLRIPTLADTRSPCLWKMYHQQVREGMDSVAVPVTACGLLEILLDVGDELLRAALWPQGAAELIVGVGSRFRELIEGFVHEKDGAVSSSADIQVVEEARGAWIASAELKRIPRDPMFLHRQAGDEGCHHRKPQGRLNGVGRPSHGSFLDELVEDRHGTALERVLAKPFEDEQDDMLCYGIEWSGCFQGRSRISGSIPSEGKTAG